MVGEGRRHKCKQFYYSFWTWGLNPRKSSFMALLFLDLQGQEDSLSRSCWELWQYSMSRRAVPGWIAIVGPICVWWALRRSVGSTGGLCVGCVCVGVRAGTRARESYLEHLHWMVPWVMEFLSLLLRIWFWLTLTFWHYGLLGVGWSGEQVFLRCAFKVFL